MTTCSITPEGEEVQNTACIPFYLVPVERWPLWSTVPKISIASRSTWDNPLLLEVPSFFDCSACGLATVLQKAASSLFRKMTKWLASSASVWNTIQSSTFSSALFASPGWGMTLIVAPHSKSKGRGDAKCVVLLRVKKKLPLTISPNTTNSTSPFGIVLLELRGWPFTAFTLLVWTRHFWFVMVLKLVSPLLRLAILGYSPAATAACHNACSLLCRLWNDGTVGAGKPSEVTSRERFFLKSAIIWKAMKIKVESCFWTYVSCFHRCFFFFWLTCIDECEIKFCRQKLNQSWALRLLSASRLCKTCSTVIWSLSLPLLKRTFVSSAFFLMWGAGKTNGLL